MFKSLNKKSALIVILLSSGFIFGMNYQSSESKKNVEKFIYFFKLPKDIQNEVVNQFDFMTLRSFRISNKACSALINKEVFEQQKINAKKFGLELVDALVKGNLEISKKLILMGQANLDVKSKKYGDKTALLLASVKGYKEIVSLLIDCGSAINIKDGEEMSALMKASWHGHLDVVRLLILAGARLDLCDDFHWTALMYASSNNYIDIVRILVEAGADLNIKSNDGRTALHLAKTNEMNQLLQAQVVNENKKRKREEFDADLELNKKFK